MLSESQQTRVWEGMLGAEIRAYYFAELSGRYYQKQRFATWATLLLTSGAAASVLADVPASVLWIRAVLVVSAAGLSLYSVVMQNQKFAVDAADLHARWNRLSREYESIWENIYADDAAQRLQGVDDRAVDISKAGSAFKNDERCMLRWEEHVVQHRLASV